MFLNIIAFCGKHFYMSRFGIVNLVDKLFVTIGIFLLVFAWVNFYLRNLWISFIFGIIISFAAIYLISFFMGKKNKKLALTKQENDEMNKLFYTFRLNSKADRLKLIKNLLVKELDEQFKKDISAQEFDSIVEQKTPLKNNFESENLQKNTKITQKNANFCVELKNGMLTYNFLGKTHLVILATQYEVINQHDLINLLDEILNVNFDEIDIICASVGNVDTNIFKGKKINFCDKHALYTLIKKHGIYPDADRLELNTSKPKFINIIKAMFTPNKARGYFLSGLIIIFSSIILPYHIYYLVFGSVLIMFSLACKLMQYAKN